jgi:hypothetical protein
MKRLIALLLVAVIGYFGYEYYQQSRTPNFTSALPASNNVVINQASGKLSDLSNVLGASIANLYEGSKEALSEVTDGKSDPIINRALENIQNEVKDLPKETVDKVKYEFCKDVVIEYENKSTKKESL